MARSYARLATEYADVPPEVLAELRSICLGLPETYEDEAWAGTRWLVRKRTFAHVLTVEGGSTSAHVRAAGVDGPKTLVTFRSSGDEVTELLTASCCVLAPKKLVALVDRPD